MLSWRMLLRMEINDFIKESYATIAPHLNEKQLRLLAAAEAKALGFGGVSTLAAVTKLSRPTITKALKELSELTGVAKDGRIRRPGGGRKKAKDTDPELVVQVSRYRGSKTTPTPLPAII